MVTKLQLSYLAGVIDSDGCIGIKRSTYAARRAKKNWHPVFSERITVKQVEPQAVELLHKCFGGYRGITKPNAKRGRPLHTWHIHSAAAGLALEALMPYLRIKKRQAKNALTLRWVIGRGRGRFFVPKINRGEKLVTATEFAAIVGVKPATVFQACKSGSIPSCRQRGHRLIPLSFTKTYKTRGHTPRRSAGDVSQMEHCFAEAKRLNKVGI